MKWHEYSNKYKKKQLFSKGAINYFKHKPLNALSNQFPRIGVLNHMFDSMDTMQQIVQTPKQVSKLFS